MMNVSNRVLCWHEGFESFLGGAGGGVSPSGGEPVGFEQGNFARQQQRRLTFFWKTGKGQKRSRFVWQHIKTWYLLLRERRQPECCVLAFGQQR